MRRVLLWFLWVCLFLGSGPLFAKDPINLGRVSVAIPDHSSSAFQQALAEAYSQALLKISGNPSIMSVPVVQNSLSQINHYLSSYSYEEQKDLDTGQPQLYLHVFFNQHALMALLGQAGQAVLSDRRPKTLVLLMTEQNGNFQVVTDDSPLAKMLKISAAKYGLPLILPIGDIDDQALLPEDGAAGLSDVAQTTLKQRYQVGTLLYGVLSTKQETVQVDWQLDLDAVPNQWQSSDKSLQDTFNDGFDHLLETLANRYGVIKTEKLQNTLLLKVTGINGLKDYLQVVKTIRHLAPVSRVSVQEMSMDSLLLRVDVNGGEEALRRSLQSSNKLLPSDQLNSTNSDESLEYRWQ